MWKPKLDAPTISIDLLNSSAIASTIVPLFNFGEATLGSGASAIATSRTIAVTAANFGAGTWTLNYRDAGVVTALVSAAGLTGWQQLVDFWNTRITQNNQGIFWATVGSPATSASIFAAPSRYQLLSAVDAFGVTLSFSNSTAGYVAGTSARVTVGGGLSYNSITSELTQQPYLITTMYVSANTISQLTNTYTLNNYDANGVSLIVPQFPFITPDIYQFVAPENSVYLSPTPTTYLSYTLEPSASVRINLWYHHASRFDMTALINSETFKNQMDQLKKAGASEIQQKIESLVNQFQQKVDMYARETDGSAGVIKTKTKYVFQYPPLIQVVHGNLRHDA